MRKKVVLEERDIPLNYLNISYYLKKYLGELPEPPRHPKTKKILQPKDLEELFPQELIRQEISLEREVEIPEEVREYYKLFRPSPLIRAVNLEKIIDTPAHIYYKYEGVSPVGSHKLNTALAQAFYNKKEGVKRLVTETGAGQWGSALALSCNFFGISCTVYMVRISCQQKPYRKDLMEIYGAEVFASPVGDPNSRGSLGMAISDAIGDVMKNGNAHYALGSVLNHVLLHQTVIGLEAKKQMEKFGEYPDVVIGCCGGGSNLAGISFPFLAEKLSGVKKNLRVVAVEPTACPSLTCGEYRYEFGDSVGLTPLLKMYTVGRDFVPSSIHAGGLRYHGDAPLVCFLYDKKIIEAKAYDQLPVFDAGVLFAKTEGIVPAPESAHAIKAAIDEAIIAKNEEKKKVILFNLSGHGLLDLGAYGSVKT